jgi:hypothetical protein
MRWQATEDASVTVFMMNKLCCMCLQELRQLFQEAAAEPAPEAPAASMETTHRAEFQPHNMHGMQ